MGIKRKRISFIQEVPKRRKVHQKQIVFFSICLMVSIALFMGIIGNYLVGLSTVIIQTNERTEQFLETFVSIGLTDVEEMAVKGYWISKQAWANSIVIPFTIFLCILEIFLGFLQKQLYNIVNETEVIQKWLDGLKQKQ